MERLFFFILKNIKESKIKNQNYELNCMQLSDSSMSIDQHKFIKHFDSDINVKLFSPIKGD